MARKIYGKIEVEGGIPPGTLLRVHAWDADVDDDDHMGTTSVRQDGSYSIEYADDKWDWSPVKPVTSWRPDIYLVVEWMEPSTLMWKPVAKSKVYSDQDVRDDREINLVVSLPHNNFCTVYGSITDKQGKPVKGYTVSAWDEDPYAKRRKISEKKVSLVTDERSVAEYLGSAISDENGEYRIRFSGNPWELTPRWTVDEVLGTWWRPDVFIKVHQKDESGVLYRSPTHQNINSFTGCRIDAVIEKS